MRPDWVRGLRDQCVAANVPFFFKQWGEWGPWDFDAWDANEYPHHCFGDGEDAEMVFRCGKKNAGHAIDGLGWRQVPEVLKKFLEASK